VHSFRGGLAARDIFRGVEASRGSEKAALGCPQGMSAKMVILTYRGRFYPLTLGPRDCQHRQGVVFQTLPLSPSHKKQGAALDKAAAKHLPCKMLLTPLIVSPAIRTDCR